MKNASCRVCGCSDKRACPGGCHWVEKDLCSDCQKLMQQERAKHFDQMPRPVEDCKNWKTMQISVNLKLGSRFQHQIIKILFEDDLKSIKDFFELRHTGNKINYKIS